MRISSTTQRRNAPVWALIQRSPSWKQGDKTFGMQQEPITLTKAELADMLFERLGLNKRESKDMVDDFFEEIRTALERGDEVKLSSFGIFQLRDKAQRPGRNPKTGEAIPIKARRVVTFHASQKLKAMVEVAHGQRNPT
jgi:integration host factor subunit alpha